MICFHSDLLTALYDTMTPWYHDNSYYFRVLPVFLGTTKLTYNQALPHPLFFSLIERHYTSTSINFLFPATRLSLPPCLRIACWNKCCICVWLGQFLLYTVDLSICASINWGYSWSSRLALETGVLRFDGILRVINTLCPYLRACLGRFSLVCVI